MMFASGLWWIVVGCGRARHYGERGGRMEKLKWEGSRSRVRGAGKLRCQRGG